MLILKDKKKKKGWEENKNCKIKYEAKADVETDALIFIAKIYPYNQIDAIEIKAVVK